MNEDIRKYTTMYVIDDERIKEYPIKKIIKGTISGDAIHYIIKKGIGSEDDRIYSYTESSRSYKLNSRFHIDSVKCVLSFLYIYGREHTYGFLMGADSELKSFILRVQNNHPEYFI